MVLSQAIVVELAVHGLVTGFAQVGLHLTALLILNLSKFEVLCCLQRFRLRCSALLLSCLGFKETALKPPLRAHAQPL